MKTRIKEITYLDRRQEFYPQRSFLGFWFHFWEFNPYGGPCSKFVFSTYYGATNFINEWIESEEKERKARTKTSTIFHKYP